MKYNYNDYSGALPEKKPIPPNDRYVPSKNCCGKCIYNIPQGTMMLLLPGFGILLIGTVLLSWTSVDSSWHDGVTQAGLILLILGAVITLGGIINWTYNWCKITPKTPSKTSISPHVKSKEPVSLVGVYTLRHDGFSVPADTNSAGPSIATIS